MNSTNSNWSIKSLTIEDITKLYEKMEKYKLPKKIKMKYSFFHELEQQWNVEIKDQYLKLNEGITGYYSGIPIEIDDYMKENYEVVW